MARSDYRLCDICRTRTFYDVGLSWIYDEAGNYILPRLGDWKVICEDCAKTHEVVIVPREEERK